MYYIERHVFNKNIFITNGIDLQRPQWSDIERCYRKCTYKTYDTNPPRKPRLPSPNKAKQIGNEVQTQKHH